MVVARDSHGPALAPQQLSHAKLATTEAHYLQRQTRGPDVGTTLDQLALAFSVVSITRDTISQAFEYRFKTTGTRRCFYPASRRNPVLRNESRDRWPGYEPVA